ncbi:hypothetical protein ACFWP2_11350 [Kitasatospora sp. NPDC058444]|uniref:hypothetical protein n=1 Tax=Kitasatospora sp. NPDC058444 TaxID=3346504 RepID=UPI00365AC4D6
MSHTDPDQRPDDDSRWNNITLDEDFIRAAGLKEKDIHRPAGAPPGPKRVWPRNLALALAAAAVTAGAFALLRPSDEGDGAPAAAAPTVAATPDATPSVSASAARASAAPDASLLPLDQLFPAQVTAAGGEVYTRVGSTVMKSCVEPDSVGPRLIGMIRASKGCLGEQIALYTDSAKNQYNLAVFTMADPKDTVHLVTELSMAFDDYQVGAQAPPPASGLATLPPDSGMVQAFSGAGRAMVAGLGQWSDGRATDYKTLVEKHLSPLQKAVAQAVFAHESAR